MENQSGMKKRNSQDFPAAGLHWLVPFKEGENQLKAVGRKNGVEVLDEIKFRYQTKKWGKPAQTDTKGERYAKVRWLRFKPKCMDQNSVACLDARNVVRFGLIGNGS